MTEISITVTYFNVYGKFMRYEDYHSESLEKIYNAAQAKVDALGYIIAKVPSYGETPERLILPQ